MHSTLHNTALLLVLASFPAHPSPVLGQAAITRLPASQAAAAPGQPTVAASVLKGAGLVRIAVASPKTQLLQGGQGASAAAEALRAVEMQYLHGPSLDIVPIAAMIPSQISAEVKEKECDYLLYSSLIEKDGASSSSSLFKKAMPFAGMIPMVGALGSVGGMMAGAATSVAVTSAAGLSSNVKARNELTLTYKLVAIHEGIETAVLENTLKSRARQDGEDVLTPLVEQEATAIINQLSAKQ